MLRKLIIGSYNFAKIGNRKVLLRAYFDYRKRTNNDSYYLEAKKRMSISNRQYCPLRQKNAIFENLRANINEKDKQNWKVAFFITIATAIIAHLLMHGPASADEEGGEEIENKGSQSNEQLNTISIQLSETLPRPDANYVDLQGKTKLLDRKLKEKDIVVISGTGGIGKSTFGNEYKQRGDKQVIWIKDTQIEEKDLDFGLI